MRKEDEQLLFKLLNNKKNEVDVIVKRMKDHDILSDGGLLISLTGVDVADYLRLTELQKDLDKIILDLKNINKSENNKRINNKYDA